MSSVHGGPNGADGGVRRGEEDEIHGQGLERVPVHREEIA